jgi:uncharacterized protein
MELFPHDKRIGVFRGFREGGFEFHADLVLPYRSEFQNIPMHGQFLLVQLETPDEAVLGRISSLASEGKLSVGAGEEFNLRALRESREVPEDLREQYLKYKVDIRVLGVLRRNGEERLTFVPSHRRLPHVGSPVAFPSDAVLREIAGHNLDGAGIGFFALGEYIYSGSNPALERLPWMQVRSPEVLVKFPIQSLVARRSFIFAKAGFGKSNLNKLLFSELYKGTPTVTKRMGKQVPVGTVIFDPDGEYFWPDDRGRPGLCDVPHLADKVVVFTSRRGPSDYYQSFVASDIKLDIRLLPPSDVISIAVPVEKQDQQNVRKLKGLRDSAWEKLVDLIHANGNSADLGEVARLLELDPRTSEMEATAARANLTAVVRGIHNPRSQMLGLLLSALRAGKLCVVDISQMRGGPSMILAGIILRYIFDHNQKQFTEANPATIPTIAVIEEAQSVLNDNATSAEPFVAWVKEGRKYDLGALLVTQQPGSIPAEILSQGDNWFLFHLLSATDLAAIRRANAHFSDDILSSLLNEPIAGQGVFWSSVPNARSGSSMAYPIALRALSFEASHTMQDPDGTRKAAKTFAQSLKEEAARERAEGAKAQEELRAVGVTPARFPAVPAPTTGSNGSQGRTPQARIDASADATTPNEPPDDFFDDPFEPAEEDNLQNLQARAIRAVRNNAALSRALESEAGVEWWKVQQAIRDALPVSEIDPWQAAYRMIPVVLDTLYGPEPNWSKVPGPNGGKPRLRARAR